MEMFPSRWFRKSTVVTRGKGKGVITVRLGSSPANNLLLRFYKQGSQRELWCWVHIDIYVEPQYSCVFKSDIFKHWNFNYCDFTTEGSHNLLSHPKNVTVLSFKSQKHHRGIVYNLLLLVLTHKMWNILICPTFTNLLILQSCVVYNWIYILSLCILSFFMF